MKYRQMKDTKASTCFSFLLLLFCLTNNATAPLKDNAPVYLKNNKQIGQYTFNASLDEGKSWQIISKELDAKNLNT